MLFSLWAPNKQSTLKWTPSTVQLNSLSPFFFRPSHSNCSAKWLQLWRTWIDRVQNGWNEQVKWYSDNDDIRYCATIRSKNYLSISCLSWNRLLRCGKLMHQMTVLPLQSRMKYTISFAINFRINLVSCSLLSPRQKRDVSFVSNQFMSFPNLFVCWACPTQFIRLDYIFICVNKIDDGDTLARTSDNYTIFQSNSHLFFPLFPFFGICNGYCNWWATIWTVPLWLHRIARWQTALASRCHMMMVQGYVHNKFIGILSPDSNDIYGFVRLMLIHFPC